MKFHCDKALLVKELTIAQEVVSNRSTISILSNILITVENGKLTLRSTDTKTAFQSIIPVSVDVPGSITVNSDKFLGSLRNLPEGLVLLELQSDGRFLIKPEKRNITYQLRTMSSENYPWVQWETEGIKFTIGQSELLDMINQTIFAVSDDDSRFFMTGVYFDYQDNVLKLVATDGRRLSLARHDMEINQPFNVIVPTKPLSIIKKLASGQGTIDIIISEKSIVFILDNQRIFSNFIDGQFPNYQRVIPDSQLYSAKINRDDFVDAIRRVSLMADQKSQRILLTLTNSYAIISSEESELGMAKEEIPIEYNGPQSQIAMNYQYLLDPLRVYPDPDVFFLFSDTKRAVTLRPISEKNFFHIVMPMQLAD
jgi:DNA polymerase-3 subunit beta